MQRRRIMVRRHHLPPAQGSDNGRNDRVGDAAEAPGGDSGDFDPGQFETTPACEPPAPPAGVVDLDALVGPDDYEQEFADDSERTVIVRKASGQGFFRAHPTLWKKVLVFEIKNGEDRGVY